MNKIFSFFKILLSIIFFIACCVIFLALIILNTNYGSKGFINFAVDFVNKNTDFEVNVDSIDGTFLSGIGLNNLTFEQIREGEYIKVDAHYFYIKADIFSVLKDQKSISSVKISGLSAEIETQQSEKKEPANKTLDETIQSFFEKSLNINVTNISIQDVSVTFNQQLIKFDRLKANTLLNQETLHINNFDFASPLINITGQLKLDSENLLTVANVNWALTDSAIINLPDSISLNENFSGNISLSGPLNNLEISQSIQQPIQFSSFGTITNIADNPTQLYLDFQHSLIDSSAILPSATKVDNISGLVNTQGSINSLILTGDFEIASSLFSTAQLNIDALFANNTLSLNDFEINNAEIELDSSGSLDFNDGMQANIQWNLNQLDLSNFLLSPITLNNSLASGSIIVDIHDEQINSQLSLDSFTADLNDYPVSVKAQVSQTAATQFEFDLALLAETNNLNLSGNIDDNLSILWEVNAPNLNILSPSLSGLIVGQGNVNGTINAPKMSGDLLVQQVLYELNGSKVSIEQIEMIADSQLDQNDIALTLTELTLDSNNNIYTLSNANLDILGTPDNHSIALTLQSDLADITLKGNGNYDNTHYVGLLNSAQIVSDFGDLNLSNNVEVRYENNQLDYEQHCWDVINFSVCSTGSWNSVTGVTASLDINDFPLGLLNTQSTLASIDKPDLNFVLESKPSSWNSILEKYNLILPENSFIEGDISIAINGTGLANHLTEQTVDIIVTPQNLAVGLITIREVEGQTFAPLINSYFITDTTLDAYLQDQEWITQTKFTIQSESQQHSELKGLFSSTFNIDVSSNEPSNNIAGEISIDFPELNWAEAFISDIKDMSGSLNGLININGSLSKPSYALDLNVKNLAFFVPKLGISIDKTNLNAISNSTEQITLQGEVNSSQGSLNINSVINSILEDDRNISLSLTGNDFLVADLPETEVAISPNLKFNFADNNLDIQGDLTIPQFILNLDEFEQHSQSANITLSNDVVIVEAPIDQQALLAESSSDLASKISITSDVNLSLTDLANFKGYGLDLNLGGDLRLEQSLNRPMLAYGEVSVLKGSYEIYRQNLSIQNGKLYFLGNPMNPALDIRAFREVQASVVGVQINGTLQNMRSNLYSMPSLPDNEILAMLITGKSFNNINAQDQFSLLNSITSLGLEKSQSLTNSVSSKLGLDVLTVSSNTQDLNDSALGLGKYLTQDLFIRYDVGLFDKTSKLILNYSLTDNLDLEVESGVSQSVDLTYKIEK